MIAELEPEKQSETVTSEAPNHQPAGLAAEKREWVRSPGIYLFLAVFILRLFALVRLTDSHFLLPSGGDMQFYNEWALRILRGQWTEQTAFYGLPLYAYLLAAIYKICGYSPFVPGLFQAACEGGTAVLLYKLGSFSFASTSEGGFGRHRGMAIGLMAAVGWAFFLPAQGYRSFSCRRRGWFLSSGSLSGKL